METLEEHRPEKRFKDLEKTKKEIAAVLVSKEMQSREKYAQVLRIAYDHLFLCGKFYFDKNKREGYWFDAESKQLWQIHSEKFHSFLSDRLQLNQKDNAFDWMLSGISDRVAEHALKVRPKRFSFYDENIMVLYINNRPGRMLRITEDKIEEIDNGNGALFLWDDDWEEFQFRENRSIDLKTAIYDKHSLDDSDNNASPEELKLLMDAYVLAIPFRELVLHRPILANVGPWGCGKTLMQVLIGIVLFGRHFEVLGLEEQKQDAVIAYITNSVFGVLDNADERVKWLPDLLARVATGQRIPRRKLYTTNELVKYEVDCFVGITARVTPWARPDIISRLLLVRFKQPDSYLNERELKQTVIDRREELISEVISKAQKAIKKLKEFSPSEDSKSSSRLAGFYEFGRTTSEDPVAFDKAFKKAVTMQNALAAEEEEALVSILRDWIASQGETQQTIDGIQGNWTKPLKASDLFAILAQSAKNKGLEFETKTVKGFGMRVKNNQTMLKAEGIRFKSWHERAGSMWQFALEGP